MKAAEKLIQVAEQEVGYLEKKSNKDLDHKTANAGSNNFTKYARDLYPALQGQAWCDMFVDWCFVQAFGKVKAQQLIGGGFSAYTPTSAQYYKNKGQYHKSNPQPGDQIFFKNSVRICHTGIVYKVVGSKVYTIEGNTECWSRSNSERRSCVPERVSAYRCWNRRLWKARLEPGGSTKVYRWLVPGREWLVVCRYYRYILKVLLEGD